MTGRALALLAAAACGCAAHSPAREGVLEVLKDQEAAWNRGDVEGFMQGYRRSPDTTFSSDSGTVRGWDTVMSRYKTRYPDRAAMGRLTFSDLEVTDLGDGAALAKGSWRLERERDAPHGVFSLVFLRLPEGWRILHDHTSAAPLHASP